MGGIFGKPLVEVLTDVRMFENLKTITGFAEGAVQLLPRGLVGIETGAFFPNLAKMIGIESINISASAIPVIIVPVAAIICANCPPQHIYYIVVAFLIFVGYSILVAVLALLAVCVLSGGTASNPEEELEKLIRIAVGHSHHRAWINHELISQDGWNQGASMTTRDWTHLMDFWAYSTKQPGTIRIAVGKNYNPSRVMINLDSIFQQGWDEGASMTIRGWTHYMDFWVYPNEQPGTIRIAVGQALDPHRVMFFRLGRSFDSTTTHGWTHRMDFWAYPTDYKIRKNYTQPALSRD